MAGEISLFGIYISPFFVDVLLAVPFFLLVRWLLSRFGFFRKVWHPALLEVSLFLILLCPIVLLI